MKKIILAAALGLGLALAGGVAANADEAPFVPYSTNQTWYAPSPATVDSPFAVAQHTAVLTCGGIEQYDEYTISTADMDAHYKALIATGTLNSSAEDAEFSPHNYTVTALPDCPATPPVVDTPPAVDVPPAIAAPPSTSPFFKSVEPQTGLDTPSLAYTGGTNVTTGLVPWGLAFLLLGGAGYFLKRRFARG